MFCFRLPRPSDPFAVLCSPRRRPASAGVPAAGEPEGRTAGGDTAELFGHYTDGPISLPADATPGPEMDPGEPDLTGDQILDRLVGRHGDDPTALAHGARSLGGAQRSRLDAAISLRYGREQRSRFLQSLTAIDDVSRPDPHERRPAPAPPPLELEDGQGAALRAGELLLEIQSGLLPAFHEAVGASDAAAALELAATIEGGVRRCGGLDQQLQRLVSEHPGALALLPQAGHVHAMLAALRGRLTVELSPQMLGGRPVAGKTTAPRSKDLDATAADEAAQTVALLGTVAEVRSLLGAEGGQCTGASRGSFLLAADAIERWRGRPAAFHFLVAQLRKEGLWDSVAAVKASQGRTAEQLLATVDANARQTGELVDVGGYDDLQTDKLLAIKRGNPTASEENAQQVFAMIAGASPEGGAAIIKRLAAKGQLRRMTGALPPNQVSGLIGELHDRPAQILLSEAIAGRLGEVSATTVLAGLEEGERDSFGESQGKCLAEPSLATCAEMVGHGFAAPLAFGAREIYHLIPGIADYDAAIDARGRGDLSPDGFSSAVTRAALVAGANVVLGTLTAGATGSFAAGFAEELGAGRTIAEIIGMGTGGAAAGVTGQAVSDVTSGERSDLDAFVAAAEGGAVGGTLFGALGAARKYLKPGAEAEALLRGPSQAGRAAAASVQTSLAELRAMVDRGLLPEADLQLALAEAESSGVAAAAAERDLLVTFRKAEAGEGGGLRVKQVERAPATPRKTLLDELDATKGMTRRDRALFDSRVEEGKMWREAAAEARAQGNEELAGKHMAQANLATEYLADGASDAYAKRKSWDPKSKGSGRDTLDNIYFDPESRRWKVVEAKGNTSQLGTRIDPVTGREVIQGTREYLEALIEVMKENKLDSDVIQLGVELEEALAADKVDYLMVRQRLDDLGNPRLAEVFKFAIGAE